MSKPLIIIGEFLWFAGLYLTWGICTDSVNDGLRRIVVFAAVTSGAAGLCLAMALLTAAKRLNPILFALVPPAMVAGVTAVTFQLAGVITACIALGLARTGLLAATVIWARAKTWATKGMVAAGLGTLLAAAAFVFSIVFTGGVTMPCAAWSLCLWGASCVAIGTEPPNPFADLYRI